MHPKRVQNPLKMRKTPRHHVNEMVRASHCWKIPIFHKCSLFTGDSPEENVAKRTRSGIKKAST